MLTHEEHEICILKKVLRSRHPDHPTSLPIFCALSTIRLLTRLPTRSESLMVILDQDILLNERIETAVEELGQALEYEHSRLDKLAKQDGEEEGNLKRDE